MASWSMVATAGLVKTQTWKNPVGKTHAWEKECMCVSVAEYDKMAYPHYLYLLDAEYLEEGATSCLPNPEKPIYLPPHFLHDRCE